MKNEKQSRTWYYKQWVFYTLHGTWNNDQQLLLQFQIAFPMHALESFQESNNFFKGQRWWLPGKPDLDSSTPWECCRLQCFSHLMDCTCVRRHVHPQSLGPEFLTPFVTCARMCLVDGRGHSRFACLKCTEMYWNDLQPDYFAQFLHERIRYLTMNSSWPFRPHLKWDLCLLEG